MAVPRNEHAGPSVLPIALGAAAADADEAAVRQQRQLDHPGALGERIEAVAGGCMVEVLDIELARQRPRRDQSRPEQIGRASCKEKGFRYGEDPGGAVNL